MGVLRQSKESLMAVLSAFVYDPLINWRLLTAASPKENAKTKAVVASSNASSSLEEEDESYDGSYGMAMASSSDYTDSLNTPLSHRHSYRKSLSLQSRGGEEVGMREDLNKKAIEVITRVHNKLTGRDFGDEVLDVGHQVQRLFNASTSYENLCQCYIGWCPFW
jgi:serine/threonine-protein kinase mTOR